MTLCFVCGDSLGQDTFVRITKFNTRIHVCCSHALNDRLTRQFTTLNGAMCLFTSFFTILPSFFMVKNRWKVCFHFIWKCCQKKNRKIYCRIIKYLFLWLKSSINKKNIQVKTRNCEELSNSYVLLKSGNNPFLSVNIYLGFKSTCKQTTECFINIFVGKGLNYWYRIIRTIVFFPFKL